MAQLRTRGPGVAVVSDEGVCGPAAAQASGRETSASFRGHTPLVEFRRGEGKSRSSYAEEMASTILLLMFCLEEPFSGDPEHTSSWSTSSSPRASRARTGTIDVA